VKGRLRLCRYNPLATPLLKEGQETVVSREGSRHLAGGRESNPLEPMALAAYWYVRGSYYALSSTRDFDNLPEIAVFVWRIIII